MKIKEITEDQEFDRFVSLLQDAFQEEKAWSRQELESLQKASHMHLALAYEKGRVVGLLLYSLLLQQAEIFILAIKKDQQKKGFGKKLMTQALKEFKRKGVQEVFLEVRAKNQPAICLYQKVGFVKSGWRKGYYREPKDDAILMKKKLERSPYDYENPCY